MFLIIIVSANNSNHVTENEFFFWEKNFTENWVYFVNIFFKSVPPLGGVVIRKNILARVFQSLPPLPPLGG